MGNSLCPRRSRSESSHSAPPAAKITTAAVVAETIFDPVLVENPTPDDSTFQEGVRYRVTLEGKRRRGIDDDKGLLLCMFPDTYGATIAIARNSLIPPKAFSDVYYEPDSLADTRSQHRRIAINIRELVAELVTEGFLIAT